MLYLRLDGRECTPQPGESAAIAHAEILLQEASCPATITIHDETGSIVASLTTRRIVGAFHKQVWVGPKQDTAMEVGCEAFDATDAILQMPIEALHELQDHDESTDQIGQLYIDWDGPHEVDLSDSICEHFGVEALTDITPAQLAFARRRLSTGADFTEQTLMLCLRVRVRVAPGTDLQEFAAAADYHIRSRSPGVVVLATELTPA